MLDTIKLNILIPLEYEKSGYEKSQEENLKITKDQVNSIKANSLYDSREWYHYCYREKKIEKNDQMGGTPLAEDSSYKITRIELNSDLRDRVGLRNNENVRYSLTNDNILFNIGKIRILFTSCGIAFLHIEIFTFNLNESETLKFINNFNRITSTKPQLQYKKKISREIEEDIEISLKDVIMNIINVQSYIKLNIAGNKIVPYFQISLLGSENDDEKFRFFESVRALSNRMSDKKIEKTHMYEGKETYVSRFVGDRAVCIYADIEKCGDASRAFITDIYCGLLKSATENYLTCYAYLISLQLLVNRNSLSDFEIEYILNAPLRISNEDNIREFLDNCLWKEGWKLEQSISSIRGNVQRVEEKNAVDEVIQMKKEMEEYHRETSKTLKTIDQKVDTIVDFIKTDLKEYIEREKIKLNKIEKCGNREQAISLFTKNVSTHIDCRIGKADDSTVDVERKNLEQLFGVRWSYLMPTSQTSLVSAGVLLKRCANINTPNFDFSGICICATSALEAELKRVFFEGFLRYMVNTYGEPNVNNYEQVYSFWPDELLSVPYYKFKAGTYKKIEKLNYFTMGSLPFLFGAVGELSEKYKKYQIHQSSLLRERMNEYLSYIVDDNYKLNPLEAFYYADVADSYIKCGKDSFVWRCIKIKDNYRNKAAHVNVMSEKEAIGCYQSIICKPAIYVYNAEITGAMIELYNKIDGNKLNNLFGNRENIDDKNRIITRKFDIGQEVEVYNIQMTKRGGIRGIIDNSDVEVSISRKQLLEQGYYAEQYVGKNIYVKLNRWDDNAQMYNGEIIENK